MELTIKQEVFVQHYFLTGNASEAYRKAYNCSRMKPETINRNAKAMLDNNKIATRIAEVKRETYERNKVTIDEVLSIASDMVRADLVEAYDEHGAIKKLQDMPKSLRMALSGIDSTEITSEGQVIGDLKKIKLTNKTPIIDMFIKMSGQYSEHNKQKTTTNVTMFKLPDNGR